MPPGDTSGPYGRRLPSILLRSRLRFCGATTVCRQPSPNLTPRPSRARQRQYRTETEGERSRKAG